MDNAEQVQDYSGAAWSNRLLKAIVEIQAAFIEENDIRQSFGRMLECLLELTDSEYGFLGEVQHNQENLPYLVTHALTDLSWDETTKNLYDASMAKGFEFHNLNTLFGVTLATGETVISNDPAADPRSGGLPKGHPGMRNYLGIPIKHRAEMLGMLGIANRSGGYQAEIVQALSPLLITAGSMIHSMRSINEHSAIQTELKEKHELLNGVIHNITDALIITDHEGTILEVNRAAEALSGYRGQELLGRSITICLADKSKSSYMDNLKTYLLTGDREIIHGRTEMLGTNKKQQEFPVDLAVNDIKLGNRKLFVNVLQDISQRKVQESKIEEANKRLQALSETDELTGLYNRRYFDEAFAKEFNRSRHLDCDLALAIIDVDYFKPYNDNYGHQQGDLCLAQVGGILKDYFKRDCEFTARIGGEEFAVVMTHMAPQECTGALEGLIRAIAEANIEHAYSETSRLTISAGLAFSSSPAHNPKDIFARADQALYKAKGDGRNRLVVADDE
jgi:diguanylate cyclase (GGDEF)-like protein/PAS domain S-box-containing protein